MLQPRSPAFASIPGPENDTQEGMKTDLPLSPLLSVCFSVREIQRFAGNVFNRASHTALRDAEGRKFCPQPRGRETEGRKEDRRSHSPCPPALHGQPQRLRRSGVSEPESKYFRLCRRSSRSYSTPRIVAKAAMNINEWAWMCSNKTLFKKAGSTVVHNGPQFANSCYH